MAPSKKPDTVSADTFRGSVRGHFPLKKGVCRHFPLKVSVDGFSRIGK